MFGFSRFDKWLSGAFLCLLMSISACTATADTPGSDPGTGNPPVTTKAATPQISPAAGTFSADQPITLSTATTGATIYYTTNGLTPTTGSTQYTVPFTIAGHLTVTTVKAIAIKSGMTDSAVASGIFKITYPPHVTSLSCASSQPGNQLMTSDFINCTVNTDATMASVTVTLKDVTPGSISYGTLTHTPAAASDVLVTYLTTDSPAMGTIYPRIQVCDAVPNCNIYEYNAATSGFYYHQGIGVTTIVLTLY